MHTLRKVSWPVFTAAVLVVLGMAVRRDASAQDSAKPLPTKTMAKDAEPDWDVAAVRASDLADTRGQHINLQGSHVLLLDTTVEQLLLLGFGVQQSQLVNLPEWARTAKWDVNGVPNVQGQPGLKQIQGLMRKILAERFGLQLHHEERELPVFALQVAKGGPRLALNTSAPDGLLDQQNSEDSTRHVEDLKNTSMSELALILQFHVNRPIVDQTLLKGRYDFKVQWSPSDAPNPAPDALPDLFTALREQIGLKLERVKAPTDVLVIDKVEKPDAN